MVEYDIFRNSLKRLREQRGNCRGIDDLHLNSIMREAEERQKFETSLLFFRFRYIINRYEQRKILYGGRGAGRSSFSRQEKNG